MVDRKINADSYSNGRCSNLNVHHFNARLVQIRRDVFKGNQSHIDNNNRLLSLCKQKHLERLRLHQFYRPRKQLFCMFLYGEKPFNRRYVKIFRVCPTQQEWLEIRSLYAPTDTESSLGNIWPTFLRFACLRFLFFCPGGQARMSQNTFRKTCLCNNETNHNP